MSDRANVISPAASPQPASDLKGRVALVTGASRGIGAATAVRLAQRGAAVAVNYHRNEAAAGAVVAAITAAGGQAIAVGGNVGERSDVERMVAATIAALGPIDILVLNATAVKNFVIAPFLSATWENAEDIIVGEVKAVWIPSQVVAPQMVARGRGSIIVVGSGLSRSGAPGFAAHSAGKSACDALVRALALELGPHGVRVNMVAPGFTETEATLPLRQATNMAAMIAAQTPLGRVAQPADIAGVIALLASDDAGFLTGVYLSASGGALML